MSAVYSIRSELRVMQAEDDVQSFFRRVCAGTSGRRPNVVLVGHAIGSLPPFLEALRQIADVSGILVKPKSAQTDVLRRVSRFYHTEILSRENCDTPRK